MFCPVEMSIHRYCDDDTRRDDAVKAKAAELAKDLDAVAEALDLSDPYEVALALTLAKGKPDAARLTVWDALAAKLWAELEQPLADAAEAWAKDQEDAA